MFQDLSSRKPALEEMDRDDIDVGALVGALRSLIRINAVGNAAGIFWPELRAVLAQHPPTGAPLRVLDVGCGGGDLTWRLERRAQRAGFNLQVDGCDRSAVAIDMAREMNTAVGASGTFFVRDAVHEPLPDGYDVIISSLFLHHLDNDAGLHVLRKMADVSQKTVLVSDLIRSRFGLLLVYIATRGLSRSPVVHADGVTSLLAAYTMDEARALAREAGLDNATVIRRWPERFLLRWDRDGAP